MFRFAFLFSISVFVLDAQMGGASAAGFLMDQASGTSLNPDAAAMPMLMRMPGSWSLMFMGQAYLTNTQETGPRGAAKLYSINYGMFSASHALV